MSARPQRLAAVWQNRQTQDDEGWESPGGRSKKRPMGRTSSGGGWREAKRGAFGSAGGAGADLLPFSIHVSFGSEDRYAGLSRRKNRSRAGKANRLDNRQAQPKPETHVAEAAYFLAQMRRKTPGFEAQGAPNRRFFVSLFAGGGVDKRGGMCFNECKPA